MSHLVVYVLIFYNKLKTHVLYVIRFFCYLQVVIANPNRLHLEFEEIIQNRTVATHCAVTLLMPKSL